MFTPQLLLVALAVFLLVTSLPALISPKKYMEETKDFFSDKNNMRMLSVWVMMFALIFLSVHWQLSGGWLILISLLGWVALAKGIFMLWFPENAIKIVLKVRTKSENISHLIAVVSIVAAIALLYIAIDIVRAAEIIGA